MTTPAETAVARAAAGLNRRAFLRAVAGATAAGIVPTGCSAPTAAWLQPPANATLQILSLRQYAALSALAARIAGPRAAAEIIAQRLTPALRADTWLATAPSLRGPITQALTVVEFGIYPLVPKLRPFTALTDSAQDAVLQRLQTGRFELQRALFAGLRSVALLGVYLSPEAYALIHYPGPFGTERVSIGDAMAALPPLR